MRKIKADSARQTPACIIARTIKGKGISYMETEPGWHLGYLAPEDEARVAAFIDILFRYPFLPAFKAILAEQIADDGWRPVRVPQFALSEPQRIALLDELRAAGMLAAREVAPGPKDSHR